MKTIDAYQIKPLDGLATGTVRAFSADDFDRLKGLGAVREATEDEVKSAPGYQNKMAPLHENKGGVEQRDANGDTAEMAKLRTQFSTEFAETSGKLVTATADIERLKGEVSSLTLAATQRDEDLRRLQDLVGAKDEEIAGLKAAAEASDAGLRQEIDELRESLAAKDAEIAALKGASPEVLKAEHHGGGKFNITRGETTLATGLTKADADAFNALSDEDKVAYVGQRKTD